MVIWASSETDHFRMTFCPSIFSCRFIQVVVITCYVAFGFPLKVRAQTNFSLGSGNWYDPTVWSMGVPAGDNVDIGGTSQHEIVISNADVEVGDIIIGKGVDMSGSVMVQSGTMSHGGLMVIGDEGHGLLDISDGASVFSLMPVLMAMGGNGTTGHATIAGANAYWEITGMLAVGSSTGHATLQIRDGALVDVREDIFGGRVSIGATGSAFTVDGEGSSLTAAGNVSVDGLMTVSGGAVVASESGTISRGFAEILGGQWLFEASEKGRLDIGAYAGGGVSVRRGYMNPNSVVLGHYSNFTPGIAGLDVQGEQGLVEVMTDIRTGMGNARIEVRDGALLSAQEIHLRQEIEDYTGPYPDAPPASETQSVIYLEGGLSSAKGVLETQRVTSGDENSRVIFDGGVLRATGNQENMVQVGKIEVQGKGGVIDTNGFDISISSEIQGGGGYALRKEGTGKLMLNGEHSFNGYVTVAEGSLWLNGSLTETNEITVENGATLGGNGDVAGSLHVFQGGRVSPGNSPGELVVDSLLLNGEAIYEWEIHSLLGTAGDSWDLITVDGDVYFQPWGSDPIVIALNSLTITNESGMLTGFDASQVYQWEMIHFNGVLNSWEDATFRVDSSGFLNDHQLNAFSVSQSGNGIYLNYNPVPVPEPSGLLLLVCSVAVMCRRRRG